MTTKPYRSLSMTVCRRWAIVSTVQSANCCRIICCTIASVSLSMEAVAYSNKESAMNTFYSFIIQATTYLVQEENLRASQYRPCDADKLRHIAIYTYGE